MTKSGFDLDEIERMLAAATPGEWRTSAGNETEIFGGKKDVARAYCGGMSGVKLAEAEASAALIVALHKSAPAMIAEIRELRAENARLKGVVETLYRPLQEAADAMEASGKQLADGVTETISAARAALGEPQ